MATRLLERFLEAQDSSGDFGRALREMRAGRKQGHWIWYVFPQLYGLGHSSASRLYGLDGLGEAAEYVRHPILRSRLLEITAAVAARLETGVTLDTLMNSHVDALKLVSSMTLFHATAERLQADEGNRDYESLRQLTGEVLAAAGAQGYSPCRFTLDQLGG
jgi:uncharacterized protein (DUF1810 family)